MPKRIVFSTGTPNDQGGIIDSSVIDFSRFNRNPVCLKEHKWDKDPIGMWTDITLESGCWSGIPVFHGLTEESRITKELYETGFLKAASIGGFPTWKKDNANRTILSKEGFTIAEHFLLYEISIVTLPSNEDAVALSAKIYQEEEAIENIMLNLSSKFKNQKEMTPEDEVEAQKAETARLAAAAKSEGDVLPSWFKQLIGLGAKVTIGSEPPKPQGLPESTQPKVPEVAAPQPKPIGLAGKKAEAKKKMEDAKFEADSAIEMASELKSKSEADGATEAQMSAYKEAASKAESCMKALEAASKTFDETDEEEEENSNEEKKSAKKMAARKPVSKTIDELRAELKLAAPPSMKARVISMGHGKTFSQLSASKDSNDVRLLGRVLTREGESKEISEYATVLNSIMIDGKFKGLVEKTRVMANVNESQIKTFQSNPQTRSGFSLQDIAAQLQSGQVEVMGRNNVRQMVTTLSSTDSALASPALNTIEWLSLAIFKLFPNSSWKNEIPIFGAEMTGKNTGIIWANIAADPTIYKGNQPVNVQNYSYNDTAVALSLTPYWMQPMLWTPLTMHQLKYDQMSTGWAQAFAKWNAVIDDNLIYTLASTVPANAIVKSSGLSGYEVNPKSFGISGANDPNAFYYNPAFVGSLRTPVLNDIITTEQIYNRQNFELSSEKPTLVVDPTMDALLSKDPETKSLLSRWTNTDGGEFVKFKNTILPQRSRVAIYDPATGQVKDPNGSIPATAVSAALGFVPSQVGIGIGMLDVFMIQDPSTYGYKMSADIRMGIVPLRADFAGTSLLTYQS